MAIDKPKEPSTIPEQEPGASAGKHVESRRLFTRRRILGILTVFGTAAVVPIRIVKQLIQRNDQPLPSEDTMDSSEQMTEQEVLEHLNSSKVELVPVAEAVQGPQYCIDGRNCTCAACMAGGDAGEILRNVATHEQMTGKRTPRSAGEILDALVSQGKKVMYMHTDYHVIDDLAKELNISLEQAKDVLRHPPAHLEEHILEFLMKHIGCGHLRFMAENTQAENDERNPYPGVRPEFVKELMREMIRRWWKDDPHIMVDPLTEKHADHREKAVVVITSTGMVTAETLIPRVQPNVNGRQIFIVHRDLEPFNARNFAQHAHEITGLPRVNPMELEHALVKQGERFLASSAAKLAKGMPVIKVRYNPGKRVFEKVE